MSRRKSRKALIAILAILLAAWWLWPKEDCKKVTKDGGDFAILSNRIWIDHIPTDERDKINVFILLDDPAFGAFSKSSAYEGDWAAFEWSRQKGLVLSMLQEQSKHKVRPAIGRGAAKCGIYDYCLHLKGAPRGPQRYGSMEDWVINGDQNFDVRQIVADIVASQK